MSNMKAPRIIRRHRTAQVTTFDCDCACAMEIVSETQNITSGLQLPAMLQKAPGLQTRALSPEYHLAFSPLSSQRGDAIAVLNGAAWKLLSHFEQPRPWQAGETLTIENTLRELLDLGFLVGGAPLQTLPEKNSSILAAWLHLTDRCNLRCDYCYLPHARADMSLDTGRAAIDATFRSALRHGHHSIKLKYAGGEPLLRFPLLLELQCYAQTLAKRHGLALDSIVLSNGTLLTEKTIERMQKAGLRLMISLDGIGRMHDCQRHYVDGHGSFKDVAQAIDIAQQQGLVPDISITVSGRNAAGLPETVAWVLKRDLPFSLNFYREHGLTAPLTDLRLEENGIIEGMLAAYQVIERNLPQRSLLASLVDRANLAVAHQHTCSAGRDYLVFDTQGRVAKCQMTLAQTVSDCHTPDPLGAVRASSGGLQNLKVSDKAACRDCEWRYWCAGGCPLQAYRATGRHDVKSPNCRIYQALYPEVIKLEGLRLLKYAH